MKMKKMVGAFALTAALAMGSVPAFAASVGSGNDEFSDNGSTEIKAKIDNINPAVRATVPLQVTVVFGGTGASDIIGPNPSAYKITNVGTGNIQVVEAEVTDMNSVFTNDPMRLDDIDAAVEDGTPFGGDNIMFYYTTADNNTYLTDGHPLSSAASGTTANRYIANAKAFTAEEIAPNDALEITLGGKATFDSTFTQDDLTDTLCKIKYTIAAAA